MAWTANGRGFPLFLSIPVAAPLLTAIVGVTKNVRAAEEQEDRHKKEVEEVVVVSDDQKRWFYWTPLTKGYHAVKSRVEGVRPSWAWVPLTKGYEAVKSGLAPVSSGFNGVLSAVQGLRSTVSLSPSVKVGVACGAAANSLGVTVSTDTALATFLTSGKLPPSYTLMVCLSVVDGKSVLDLVCSNDRRVLALKEKLMATVSSSEVQVPPQLLALQVYSSFSSYLYWFPSSSEDLMKVKDYVGRCVNGALSGNWFGHVTTDLKVVAEFFARHDLTWALQTVTEVVGQLNCPKVEAACGALSGVYQFSQNVVSKALGKETISLSQLKFTPGDVLQIVKLCVNEQQNLYSKLERICWRYILPRAANYASIVLRRSVKVGDEEVLRAASKAVGAELSTQNALVTQVGGDIYVIITDKNIEVSVLKILVDKEQGTVQAVVARRNGDTSRSAG